MEDRSYLGAVNEVLIQLADSNSMVDASIKMLKELAEDLKSSGGMSKMLKILLLKIIYFLVWLLVYFCRC